MLEKAKRKTISGTSRMRLECEQALISKRKVFDSGQNQFLIATILSES